MYEVKKEELFKELKNNIVLELERMIDFYVNGEYPSSEYVETEFYNFKYNVHRDKEDDGTINYKFEGFKILNSGFGSGTKERNGKFYDVGYLNCRTMLPFEIYIYPLEDEITVSFICYTKYNFMKEFKEEFNRKVEEHYKNEEKFNLTGRFHYEDIIIQKMKKNFEKQEEYRILSNKSDEFPVDKETITFTWNLDKSVSKFLYEVNKQLNTLCANSKEIEYY